MPFFEHLEEVSRGWIRRFSPTEYQPPPGKPPGLRSFRTAICYQTPAHFTGGSSIQSGYSIPTCSLPFSLLVSPPQPICSSVGILFLFPQRLPLETGRNTITACLLQHCLRTVSITLTCATDLSSLRSLCNDGKPPVYNGFPLYKSKDESLLRSIFA